MTKNKRVIGLIVFVRKVNVGFFATISKEKCNILKFVGFSKFVGFFATKKFVAFYTTGPRCFNKVFYPEMWRLSKIRTRRKH